MRNEELSTLINNQRRFVQSGKTLSYKSRKSLLLKLKTLIKQNKNAIAKALYQDLGKSEIESYMSELQLLLSQLNYTVRHLKRWMKKKRRRTPLVHFPAKSYQMGEPYGVVLIMVPWNYPFLLALNPLIGAFAAGNCVVLKPSEFAPNSSQLLFELLSNNFDKNNLVVVQGAIKESSELLENRFDYIFFTGSSAVGKIVYAKAAQNLTPVTLELGGKSPAIIDATADIALSAKRVVFGKFLNSGQTCVAVDYLLVEEKVKEQLLSSLVEEIKKAFVDENYADYPKIINKGHFDRLLELIDKDKIYYGGTFDEKKLKIYPTILNNISFDSPIMQQEIFGPLLPVLSFTNFEKTIEQLQTLDKPLSLYIFTKDKNHKEQVLKNLSFGGGCVNDTVIHMATPYSSFGGVGNSGIGSYHGKKSFDTFSHYKTILEKSTLIDLPFRYHPYTKFKQFVIKLLVK